MDLIAPIKDHHHEKRVFATRVLLAAVIGIVLLAIVVGRLVQLQVYDYEAFAAKSQGNRIRIEAVPPIRGLIYDRNGNVLAENQPAYHLELIPEDVPDINDTLRRLANLGLIEEKNIESIKELASQGPRFKPVTLRFRLSDQEISDFALQRPRFRGVDFQPRLVRYYRHAEYTAHAVGYVGALSTADLERFDETRYAGTSHAGKTGVEYGREYDLHGDAGHRQVMTNARGRQLPTNRLESSDVLPADESPYPGRNIYLSIDLELQKIATEAMRDWRGSVVAIDPRNGEVLTLVSSPAFDPNVFALGMTTTEFNSLQYDLDRPLFNRAVRGNYPPGSTIKPMLALAALEVGATNLTRRTLCPGFYSLPGSSHRYRDWKPAGHGEVDLHDSIEQSCDVYFYEISRQIGIDRMHFYLDQFGLGHATGVDLVGEKAGLVPSRAWKRSAFREPADQTWFPGETVIASIGQGYMLATPMQLANATAALAMRGRRFQPRLVIATEDPIDGDQQPTSVMELPAVDIENDFYWDSIVTAMNGVLQGTNGTARAVGADAAYTMAGKSGTAQVFSIGQDEEYDEEEIAERLRDHALFIAFAPLDDPRIAVAVVVENGSSGSRVAAPIAKAIIDHHIAGIADEI